MENNIYKYQPINSKLQTLAFIDIEELYVVTGNMSYERICNGNGDTKNMYLIHEYKSFTNNNLFPLYDIECQQNDFNIFYEESVLIINGSINDNTLFNNILKQLNIQIIKSIEVYIFYLPFMIQLQMQFSQNQINIMV